MSYSKSTIRRAEEILGYGFAIDFGSRSYDVIDGVAYVDLFDGTDVVVGGTRDYKFAFNGKKYGTKYYNEVHVGSCAKSISITANWGVDCFEDDIKELLDWLAQNPVVDNLEGFGIKSKKIEDFSISVGSVEERNADKENALLEGFGYYIRRPVLFSVSGESNATRYF